MFNIFIYYSSLHVSGIHVPIIRRKIAVYMRHLYLSLCMGGVWSALLQHVSVYINHHQGAQKLRLILVRRKF